MPWAVLNLFSQMPLRYPSPILSLSISILQRENPKCIKFRLKVTKSLGLGWKCEQLAGEGQSHGDKKFRAKIQTYLMCQTKKCDDYHGYTHSTQ